MIKHVPPHIFGALYRYYKHNCQPGSCTSAIIKAVEDAVANSGTISDADQKVILDAIASVYEPS
jgi:hypothetical protein